MATRYDFAKYCDSGRLSVEIKASTITIGEDHIETTPSSTAVFMKADLTEGEQTTLAAIVAAHTATPLPDVQVRPVEVVNSVPFAAPLYRTKHNSPDPVTCAPGETATIDYPLTEDRYVHGGAVLIAKAQPGDWWEAGIFDTDGVIPEAYRAALCEAWPLVASYCEKCFILVENPGVAAVFEVDTRPLIAKITAGLVLRAKYHATAEGDTRTICATYHMLKAL
jgi:hypothetical protein